MLAAALAAVARSQRAAAAAAGSSVVRQALQAQQRRWLNIHEYQVRNSEIERRGEGERAKERESRKSHRSMGGGGGGRWSLFFFSTSTSTSMTPSFLSLHPALPFSPLLFQNPPYHHQQKKQGAKVMAARGVNVPPGIPVSSLSEVPAAAKAMASPEDNQVVVKSQILAGGRGLGKFTNGFQGGVHVCDVADAPEIAAKMLGGTLVTKQSGPAGKPVNTLLIAKKLELDREMYLAILLDRKAAGPVLVACPEGGTSIEDLAAEFPDMVRKVTIDPREGLTDAQADEAVAALQVRGDKDAAKEQIKALYKTFAESDCTMVEVNPLAETADGVLVAADAKLGFDDSASYRQKELFAMRDASQEDPR